MRKNKKGNVYKVTCIVEISYMNKTPKIFKTITAVASTSINGAKQYVRRLGFPGDKYKFTKIECFGTNLTNQECYEVIKNKHIRGYFRQIA